MRAAIMDNGTVVNVILLAEGADPAAFGAVACPTEAQIGWRVEGERFLPPPAPEPVEAPDPVPTKVTNYQARAVMRQVAMPDGRSLFTTVDTALREGKEAAATLPEFDPDRVRADLAWQAWEQANTYERHGLITTALAGQFGFDDARTDELFRQADKVTA